MLSVLIATADRSESLLACLESLSVQRRNLNKILVIDQSRGNETENLVRGLAFPYVSYIRSTVRGKSNALNVGLQAVKTDIVAFTDDDCLVGKHWAVSLADAFRRYPEVTGVFGRSLPYRPQSHPGLMPISLTTRKEREIFSAPSVGGRIALTGNCMAFRTSIFRHIGPFKPWLGPGSIGIISEDEEFLYRSLLNGYKILFDPVISVYHNRWLVPAEYDRITARYRCGFYATYTFHAVGAEPTSRTYLKNEIGQFLQTKKTQILSAFRHRYIRHLLRLLLYQIPLEGWYAVRGVGIGLVYSLLESRFVPKKPNALKQRG
jgi:GT2 family glycosyltransferase